MFRTALLRSARCAMQASTRQQAPIARKITTAPLRPSKQFVPASSFNTVRCYSAHAGLGEDEVQGRILDLLKNFDKVSDASKEFSIEIPDKEADAIHSVDQAVKYILSQPDGTSTSDLRPPTYNDIH
ncbi:hypothetical protein LTR28_011459 [Elasticomyces elasticus]|nr:hypothetical protein LTR28_011459 [Elasticomyces elasticus]